ncbi:hypothetical protein ACFSUI_18265 [Ralstonia solanacearum]
MAKRSPLVKKPRLAPQAARLPGAAAGKRDDAVAAHIERLQREAGRIEREVGPLLRKLQLQVIEQHSVAKKAKSIDKKIRRVSLMNGIPLEQAADRVRDAMRWVVRLPHGTFGAQAREALEALKANGLRITRVNNGFAAKDRTYAGLNVKLQTWQGLDFEIQFHTADSLYTKQRTHKIYRQWQDKEVERAQASDPATQRALQQANAERLARLRTYASTVPMPVGAEAIASFDDAPRRRTRPSLPGSLALAGASAGCRPAIGIQRRPHPRARSLSATRRGCPEHLKAEAALVPQRSAQAQKGPTSVGPFLYIGIAGNAADRSVRVLVVRVEPGVGTRPAEHVDDGAFRARHEAVVVIGRLVILHACGQDVRLGGALRAIVGRRNPFAALDHDHAVDRMVMALAGIVGRELQHLDKRLAGRLRIAANHVFVRLHALVPFPFDFARVEEGLLGADAIGRGVGG